MSGICVCTYTRIIHQKKTHTLYIHKNYIHWCGWCSYNNKDYFLTIGVKCQELMAVGCFSIFKAKINSSMQTRRFWFLET